MDAQDYLKAFYEGHCDEDARLRNRHGMVEFLTIITPAELFALHRKEDIDARMDGLPVKRLHFVGTDMATGYMADTIDQMDEELYDLYLRCHFATCERTDLVGASNHYLDIFQKL